MLKDGAGLPRQPAGNPPGAGVLHGAFRPEAGGEERSQTWKTADSGMRNVLVCANQSCCLLNASSSRFSKREESVAGPGRAGQTLLVSLSFSFSELSVTCNLQ